MIILKEVKQSCFGTVNLVMQKLQIIEITAETPFLRGVQYGEQAKALIEVCVNHYKERFEKAGNSWDAVAKYALQYVDVIQSTMPEVLEEARGIAQGSGQSLGDIMVVNCRYEITKFPKVPECTTAAILGNATRNHNTYVVKNWDYSQGIMPHMVLLHIHTADGYSLLGITEAGQMVRDGFNSHGIALVNNNLQSVNDYQGIGIPVTFLRRYVLNCTDFDHAETAILEARRCVSSNILLTCKQGRAVDYETHPNGADCIYPEDGLLTHANHFVVTPALDALTDRPQNRDTRLLELFKIKAGDITLEDIKACMCDHEYYPLSICGHPTPDGDSYTKDRITVASVIFDLSQNVAHICVGPPCEGEYVVYNL